MDRPLRRPTTHLDTIIRLCKCGVHLMVNDHRDYNQTAEVYLKEVQARYDEPLADADVLARMVETDTIIHLQCYPRTPICFHSVYHYDLQAACEQVLAEMEARTS